MGNSVAIKKSEISFSLKEFKKLIELHSDKVAEYLKNEQYFQNTEEMINDKDMNSFSTLKYEYYDLANEFRKFVLPYNISHDDIQESILDNIIKISIEYFLHEQPKGDCEESDSDDGDSDDDEPINNEEPINNKETINNEETINNGKPINNEETTNNEQLMNNNLTMIINILKEPTTNNKEYLISDVLNKSMISNILNQSISNNLKEILINNILKKSMTNKILKKSTINNKESLIKHTAINNILTQPMNNILK